MRIKNVIPHKLYEIPNCNSKYYINTDSEVKRINASGHYVEVKKSVKKDGRVVVRLNGKEEKVSKLMQRTFWGELKDGYVLMHNDSKSDDSYENLYIANKKYLYKKCGRNGQGRVVAKMDKQGNVVDFYPSIRFASRVEKIKVHELNQILNSEYKRFVKGFTYCYDD